MDLLKQLTEKAQQARRSSNLDSALTLYQRAHLQFPSSVSAAHNYASVLFDLRRFKEAKALTEHTFQIGGNAFQTWLMYARILIELHEFDTAQIAYQKAIQLLPTSYEAHREYAQVIWMRSGDISKSTELLDKVLKLKRFPWLVLLKAQIYDFSDDFDKSIKVLQSAIKEWPDDTSLLRAIIFSYLKEGKPEQAVYAGEKLLNSADNDINSYTALGYAYLANGQAEKALAVSIKGLKINEFHQELIANKSSALYALGQLTGIDIYKNEYDSLYNFSELVKKIAIEPPAGWRTRIEFFKALAEELKKLHPYKNHPFGQSVRHGSQLPNLLAFNNPVINAFKRSLKDAINLYLGQLKLEDHPLSKRNIKGWKIDGIWSVWLQPGGYHENHIHPHGWLSTACYIDLPDVINNDVAKEGWLRLGQPPLAIQPEIPVGQWVKPEVGHIVIFPSYMWHGTQPFSGQKPRLSIALDIVPT